MPKLYKFKVTGVSNFPIDMLRYDECFPLMEADSVRIIQSLRYQQDRVPYVIELIGYRRIPTYGRWKSFGWRVINETAD